MGGDHVPQSPIAGVKSVLPLLGKDTRLTLVGPQDVIAAELAKQGLAAGQFDIAHANDVIGMDEHPAKAFMLKQNSSIAVGLTLVKEGNLDAFISAGNTGAMLVASVLTLGNIEGVQRPLLGALYPYKGQYSLLADVGLNSDCKPEQLAQFGHIGSIFMQAVWKVTKPRVALLNIGEEKSKGNQLAQQTYPLLAANDKINFIGNAEGRDFNKGHADVYVCDGFVGNIVLKLVESFYPLLKEKAPNDKDVEAFNYEHVGGLPILGINGNVLIGHGSSGPLAFHNMVLRATEVVQSDLVGKIRRAFADSAAS
jgi:glycerol-3-phosphate acyltransferase PlsX